MKNKTLATQYNGFASDYAYLREKRLKTSHSTKIFYSKLGFLKKDMALLDLGCGNGIDLKHYESLGVDAYGIDSSKELIYLAQKLVSKKKLKQAFFQKVPFEKNYFDVVLSKYAIMTSKDLMPVFKEIHRVLKPGGTMMFLVTHPLRQYLEKNNSKDSYFKQIITGSRIFNNKLIIKQPSHTLSEYLNTFLLKNFDITLFEEHIDPDAEAIENRIYPGFLILKAIKRA